MIEGFYGLPGAGKTYLMSRNGVRAVRKGKIKVYANYPLKGAVRFDRLDQLYKVRDGLILLDEAGLVLAAQQWKAIPFEVLVMWREHRHHGLTVQLTCQHPSDVAKFMRQLIQFWVRVERIGPMIRWARRDSYGRKMGSGLAFLDKDIFRQYDTLADVARQDWQS